MTSFSIITETDPLGRTFEKNERELFAQFATIADGWSRPQVARVAMNLLVNAIRQDFDRRDRAEANFDFAVGQMKQRLMDCYDAATGARRSVFAFDQHIVMPMTTNAEGTL